MDSSSYLYCLPKNEALKHTCNLNAGKLEMCDSPGSTELVSQIGKLQAQYETLSQKIKCRVTEKDSQH